MKTFTFFALLAAASCGGPPYRAHEKDPDHVATLSELGVASVGTLKALVQRCSVNSTQRPLLSKPATRRLSPNTTQ